jgi:hypothetical protein
MPGRNRRVPDDYRAAIWVPRVVERLGRDRVAWELVDDAVEVVGKYRRSLQKRIVQADRAAKRALRAIPPTRWAHATLLDMKLGRVVGVVAIVVFLAIWWVQFLLDLSGTTGDAVAWEAPTFVIRVLGTIALGWILWRLLGGASDRK